MARSPPGELSGYSDLDRLFQERARLDLPEVRQVGRILQILSMADARMEVASWEENNHGAVRATDFGGMVGPDEARWWVFARETNVIDLRDRSRTALASAQILRTAALTVSRSGIESYQALVQCLARFCTDYQADIGETLNYVANLESRDPLAPTALWTYEIWGDTRRMERVVAHKTSDRSIVCETDPLRAAESALGLRARIRPMIYEVHSDQESRIANNWDEERGHPPRPPLERVVRETIRRVLEGFSEFFSFLRDSVRHVLTWCEVFLQSDALAVNEGFWSSFAKEVLEGFAPERKYWDAKQTLPFWLDSGIKHKYHFAADISALANTEGGVIIVGLTDQQPRSIVDQDISDNKRRAITDIIRSFTNLGPDSVRLVPFSFDDGEFAGDRCLAIVVPRAPFSVSSKDSGGGTRWYVRDESGTNRIVGLSEVENAKRSGSPSPDFHAVVRLSAWLGARHEPKGSDTPT